MLLLAGPLPPSSPGTLLWVLEWTLRMYEMILKWMTFLRADMSQAETGPLLGLGLELLPGPFHGVTISFPSLCRS